MSRTGPVTKNTASVALGLAKILVGVSSTHIAAITAALDGSDDSIGALANTKFTGSAEYWELESGFPLLPDLSIPMRESASLECSFKEITPFNVALARGKDAAGDGYSKVNFSGEIALGGLVAPEYVRMEAEYTFPNGTNKLHIIFPRANVTSDMEMDFQAEDNVNVPITFEAKRADSEVSGGNAVWDNMPLGRIYFA